MGLEAFQARKIAFMLGLKPKQINQAVQFLTGLYKAFLDTDASLLEINPFITTTDGRLFALDAKMKFDDNALVPPSRTCESCATSPKKIRWKSKPRSTASTTSSSTATWVAW